MAAHGTREQFGYVDISEYIYTQPTEDTTYDAYDGAIAGKFAQPTGTTTQYIRGDGSLATFPTSTSRSFSAVAVTLNSATQISTTRDSLVSYSVDISCTLSLTGGQTGTVFLEYADDSAFTTNVVEAARTANGNSGTLTIGLNITQLSTASVSGAVPAGKYRRLRTANTLGTPVFTYRSGQEVLL